MLRSFTAWTLALLAQCCALLTLAAADKLPRAAREAEAQANAEARELVQEALLAESLGDNERRSQRLAAAFDAAPQSPAANWNQARVRYDGEWLPVALAVHRHNNDPNSKKYIELREKVLRSDSPTSGVKALRDLAAWCLRTDRADVAAVHYAQLLAHPAATAELRQEAIKALDLHEVNGTLVSGEELAQRKAAAAAIDRAFAQWEGRLKRLREQLDTESQRGREKGAADLAQLTDPSIIPVLEAQLSAGGERLHLAAIDWLDNFPQYEATVALARCAVLSNHSAARNAATSALRDRPLPEFVPLLLGELAAPYKSQFRVGWDATGRIGYSHALVQEGLVGNRLLLLSSLSLPDFRNLSITIDNRTEGPDNSTASTTSGGGKSPQEAFLDELDRVRLIAAQRELEVRQANAIVERSNERLYEALEGTTGQRLARETSAWGNWWQSYNDYQLDRPTQYAYQHSESVYSTLNYSATTLDGTRAPAAPRLAAMECFVKGMPIRTDRGLVAIETILPGDRVLAQDQDSGELTFKTVVATTLRPPTKVVRVRAGGEEIVTTPGHPFWVSGRGWRMAKQLQTGDRVHTLGGALPIDSVETLTKEEPVHNLVVDDFNTYFVGQTGLLVHDSVYRRATTAIVPGLPVQAAGSH